MVMAESLLRRLKESVAGVLFSLRYLTADFRIFPNVLIVGGSKCGSTSLWTFLKEHPQVIVTTTQVHLDFFTFNYGKGTRWYKANFPTIFTYIYKRLRYGKIAVIDFSPYYLFHPLAAHRAGQLLPEARLLFTLRDPIDRAFSAYQHSKRRGFEALSFAQAVKEERKRLLGEEAKILQNPSYHSFPHFRHSYIARGKYLRQLKSWEKIYGKSKMHIVLNEDTRPDVAQKTLDSVCSFLGIRTHMLVLPKLHNVGKYSERLSPIMRRKLSRYFSKENSLLSRYLGRRLNWGDVR
jgi:hypothetical protein